MKLNPNGPNYELLKTIEEEMKNYEIKSDGTIVKINQNEEEEEEEEEHRDKKEDTKEKEKIKELEGKYSNQVLCRPNVVKMRKTLIFTSDPEKIKQGLNTLSKDEKEKLNQNIESLKGELPEPRDGQTLCVDGTNIYVFGGDRFKFPFNDLFVLDTHQLPKLQIKDSVSRKREKEREKIKQNEEKKRKEEEEKIRNKRK